MDAQYLEAGTTVLTVLPAGDTASAGKIGKHTDSVPDLQIARGTVNFVNDTAQLVAEDPRIG